MDEHRGGGVRPPAAPRSTARARLHDLVPERRDRRVARVAKLPLGPFVSVDNARATVSKRDRDRALPRRTDTRTRSDSRTGTADPRASATCHRASRASRRTGRDARHPEQTRARVAARVSARRVAAAARSVPMCDDKTYVWSNFRFF